MTFLLDPNLAYFMLVLGFVLGLLALVTPGTGLLEVGAVFCLVLPALVAFRQGVNGWALAVLVASLVPFIFSIRKPHREGLLVLSLLMIIGGSLYLFPGRGWVPAVHPLVATLSSLLATVFLWFVVRKTTRALAARPAHDLARLVGQLGEAKTRVQESGSVQVAGELWTARSEKAIPAGETVRVLGREGFILIVERVKSPSQP